MIATIKLELTFKSGSSRFSGEASRTSDSRSTGSTRSSGPPGLSNLSLASVSSSLTLAAWGSRGTDGTRGPRGTLCSRGSGEAPEAFGALYSDGAGVAALRSGDRTRHSGYSGVSPCAGQSGSTWRALIGWWTLRTRVTWCTCIDIVMGCLHVNPNLETKLN